MTDTGVTVMWCDYGGVLTPPIVEAQERVASAFGLSWDQIARAANAVAAEWGLFGFGPLERGLLTQREWTQRLSEHLSRGGAALDLSRFGEVWNAQRQPNNALLDRLDRLRVTGLRVGMLTNSVAEWEPFRRQLLRGRAPFDAVLRSHELRIAKPDPEIFAQADTVLPPAAGFGLLIDDSDENCRAARAHGWLAVLHRDTESTLEELQRIVAHERAHVDRPATASRVNQMEQQGDQVT